MGKADLGRTLAEATGRTHLSVGQMLREEAKKDTEEAQMINQAITMGVLVATVCMHLPLSLHRKIKKTRKYEECVLKKHPGKRESPRSSSS